MLANRALTINNNRTVVSCASDKELAKDLYENMLTNLKSIQTSIKDFMTLTVDEIEVENNNEISSEGLRELLSSYLKSDPRFNGYVITELENIFTIGIKNDLLKEMIKCEYCGYLSRDYHDMYNHRLFCFSLTRLGM